MVQDCCFWNVWAAGPVDKKSLADYKQLLRAVFHVLPGRKRIKIIFENIIVSALKIGIPKDCITNFQKNVLNFLWNKTVHILNCECTTERSSITGLDIYTRY